MIFQVAVPGSAVLVPLVSLGSQFLPVVNTMILENLVGLCKDGESHLAACRILSKWIFCFWIDGKPADTIGTDMLLHHFIQTRLLQGIAPDTIVTHVLHFVNNIIGRTVEQFVDGMNHTVFHLMVFVDDLGGSINGDVVTYTLW